MPRKLYICVTYHHVLVSFAKHISDNSESDIVLCSNIPQYIDLAKRIEKTKLFCNVYCFDNDSVPKPPKKGRLWNYFNFHNWHANEIEKLITFDMNQYGDIYLFHDSVELGLYLQDRGIRYHLMEDGINAFQVLKDYVPNWDPYVFYSAKYKIYRWLNLGYFPWGQSKYCIDIEVNDKSNLCIPQDKVVECNKIELLSNVPEKYREIIFKVFVSNDNTELNDCKNLSLLLTQPLAIDNMVPNEDAQIQVVKDIVNQYFYNGCFAIKPHPRDNMDYSELFPNAIIIDSCLPIEVLNYSSIHFDLVVTIASSSIKLLSNADRKISVGLEYLEKYKKCDMEK